MLQLKRSVLEQIYTLNDLKMPHRFYCFIEVGTNGRLIQESSHKSQKDIIA